MRKRLPYLAGAVSAFVIVVFALLLNQSKIPVIEKEPAVNGVVLDAEQETSQKSKEIYQPMSERKKKVKGINAKDSPNLYAEWHRGIRTRDGEEAPSYKINYQLKELLSANKASSLHDLQQVMGKTNSIGNWNERGPSNISGRTRGILIDPNAPLNTWFAGSVGGGVWKTTDAGYSWTAMTPMIPNMATSCLAWSVSNTNTIYVGTGEGFGNVDQVDGLGIWKSTNGGVDWTQLASTANSNFQNVTRMVVDPENENIILAATTPGFHYRAGPEQPTSKILRSTNGGTDWTIVHEAVNGSIEQIIVNPKRFNTQYATINSVGVIKSKDGGLTWTDASEGIGAYARMEIAISPVDTSNLFISAEGGSNGSTLLITFDGATMWYPCEDETKDNNWLSGQGWYDNTIAASLYQDSVVYVGGIDLWRFDVKPTTVINDIITVDYESTQSWMRFVNFGMPYAGGGIGKGTDFHGIVNGLIDDDYVSVEIRFGSGKSQKAHRFYWGSGWQYEYKDYIDVPFEVWDITNNRQLMVSFRDQYEDSSYNLINWTSDVPREYMFVNAVAYNAVTPDTNIAKTAGITYKNIWVITPYQANGTTWDADNLPETIIRINNTPTDFYQIASTNITNAYKRYGLARNVRNVHVDHHNIVLVPIDKQAETFRFMTANDGGVQYSDDLSVNAFTSTYTGYNTSQFYGIDKMNGADRYVGGAQDNGSFLSLTNPGAISSWYELPSGDGFEAVWNYNDPNKIIESSQFNSIYLSRDGGSNWEWIGSKIENPNGPFFTKLADSKQDPNLVFAIGASGVWRTDDFAENFTLIPMPPAGSGKSWNGTSSFSQIKISLANPQVVWTATYMTAASPLFVSTNAGLSFTPTDIFTDVTLGRLTGLETHPTEDSTAYALFSFADAPKILKTEDLGTTWEDISGFGTGDESTTGFPDVAVFSLLIMPYNTDIIWAGTEIGLFESTDGGVSWAYADNGLPPVSVYDMIIVNNEVVVATHGRGIWTVELAGLAGYKPPPAILSPRVANLGGGFGGIVTGMFRFMSAYDSSVISIDGEKSQSFPANTSPYDKPLTLTIPITADSTIAIEMKSYYKGRTYSSPAYKIELFPMLAAVATYSNDFNTATTDFHSDGLEIATGVTGFSTDAVHSAHPYADGANFTYTLLAPIIVAGQNALMSYKDIAIVEPGDTDGFWDYIVVEGSIDNGTTWRPLLDKYDANFDTTWLNAYNTGTDGDSTMYVNHLIDLHTAFSAADEVIIRFRLFADANSNGWGWAFDDLEIQTPVILGIENSEALPASFELYQNFPNPFNPITTIKFDIPRSSKVSIKVFDVLGRKVATLVNENLKPGNHDIKWNAKNYASGIYLYRIQAGDYTKSLKLMLLK